MKIMSFQASLAAALVLAAAWLASPVSAQTQAAPAAPVQSTAQPSAVSPAPVVAPPAAPQAVVSAAAKSDTAAGIAPAMKELSPWVMFMSADIIVKAVMIGLAFASLMTWTVLIAKSIELSIAATKLRSALKKIAEARSLAEAQMALDSKAGILPSFLAAALREARMSAGLSSDTVIKERAASSFSEIMRAEARRIRVGMGVLATIGSTSPFVGLFGTVWGIMNSFSAIAARHDTTLAVVAPGIAEALFATAMGLLAAIPAVIFYNRFVAEIGRYVNQLDAFADEFSAILSRQLDEKAR